MSKRLFLLSLCSLFVTAAAQAADSAAKFQLEKVLTCEQSASPEEVVVLIRELGGRAIVHASRHTDAEYTVPNPVELFGRPVTKISIHQGIDADGDYNEYSAIFSGESIETIAKIAGITPNADGIYRKSVGGHDLTLRPEAGMTYIACSNDVRSMMRSIKHTVFETGKHGNEQ